MMIRCLAMLLIALAVVPASAAQSYADRPDVRAFIDDMVREHGFVKRELEALFRKAVRQPDIIRAMTPPPEAPVRSWQNYRAFFVNAQRIEAGQRFGARHADILRRANAPTYIHYLNVDIEGAEYFNKGTLKSFNDVEIGRAHV